MTNRRQWLMQSVAAMGAGKLAQAQEKAAPKPLDIHDFQPKSMLHAKVTNVEKAKFPVIDIHTHMSFSRKGVNGVPIDPLRRYVAPPEEMLPVMDRRNIRALVNLTGGYGDGLKETIAKYDRAHPGRFYTFTEPAWAETGRPDYPKFQADLIAQAKMAGARGMKVLKVLGLYLRDHVSEGKLVTVDDARFDPMWEACGAHKLPVAIHVSDPSAFFTPIDRYNERFEELNAHPDWSFYGKDFPTNEAILEARNRVFARHRNTQFIALHVGNFAENLENVSQAMEKYPNMAVEIAARIGELGRQPRATRAFFERYQDRILFGTDAIPHGNQTPQQIFGDDLYKIYYRFLETNDEYFDYAPAPVPPQGRWRISGIALPDAILEKVYFKNAARLLGLQT